MDLNGFLRHKMKKILFIAKDKRLSLWFQIVIIKKTKTLPQVLTLFILQAIISQIAYALFGLVEDEKIYHATGITLMNSLNSGEGYQNFGVGPGKQSFTYILGTLYFWFGPYPIVGMLVNALIIRHLWNLETKKQAKYKRLLLAIIIIN